MANPANTIANKAFGIQSKSHINGLKIGDSEVIYIFNDHLSNIGANIKLNQQVTHTSKRFAKISLLNRFFF